MKHPIKEITGAEIGNNYIGDGDYVCHYASNLDFTDETCVSFYKRDDKSVISKLKTGILIVPASTKEFITDFSAKCIIFDKDPFRLFAKLINDNYRNVFTDEIIEYRSQISKNAYVEDKVKVGKNTIIYPNTSIFNGTEIGKNCEILSNTSIGTTAMSYFKENGSFQRMAHLGKVIVEDNVDIGCNTTVLKGILETTIIRKGAKIGNHVNIGHNVDIGENTYISAGVMIGGASNIGKNCWIAPGVSIRDHITIGDNCTIGVGSVVVKNLEPNGIYYGNPATFAKTKTD